MTKPSLSRCAWGVVVAVTVLLQAACGQAPASPSATAAGTLSVGAGATGGADRPFSGECRTTFEFVMPSSDAALPPPTAGLVTKGFVTISGNCILAHLGNSTTEALERLEGPPDTPPEVITKIQNAGWYTAANGDKLMFTMTGDVSPGDAEWPVRFAGGVTLRGGTGRFTNASGSTVFDGGARFLSATGGVGYFVHPQGTVSY
jgi:hypothetical protein